MNSAQRKEVVKLRRAAANGNAWARSQLAQLAAALTPEVIGAAAADAEEVRRGDDLERADQLSQEADLEGSDELDRKALLRKHKAADLGAVAPWVNQNPPGVINGQQGNAATVQPGELKQVCNFQTDDPHCSTLTLAIFPVQQLNVEDNIDTTGPIDIPTLRPFARIRFGCKGAAATAFVDIGPGIQLNVSGSMATIEVGLHPDISGQPLSSYDPLYQQMQLAGMISSFKPIDRVVSPTFTVYCDTQGGAPIFYRVPPFAKNVRFEKTTRANDVLLALSPKSVSDAGYDIDIPATTQMTAPIPVSGNISLIAATNAAGNANEAGQLIFELSL